MDKAGNALVSVAFAVARRLTPVPPLQALTLPVAVFLVALEIYTIAAGPALAAWYLVGHDVGYIVVAAELVSAAAVWALARL